MRGIKNLPDPHDPEVGEDPDLEDYELSLFGFDEEKYVQFRRTWSNDRGLHWYTIEEEINKKEYFKRKLEGTLPTKIFVNSFEW